MLEANLAKDFLEVIPRAMRVIRQEMRKTARADLTVPQFRVLAMLSQRRQTNRELAEAMGNSAPCMSRMVGFLLKKGLISQVRDGADRRLVYVELTRKGRAKFESIKSRTQIRIKGEFANLPATSKAALLEGLRVIDDVFGRNP